MSCWHKKRGVMRRYDVTAGMYDMRYTEEQTAKIEAALKNMKIEKCVLTLDVGCGTGILFDYAADRTGALVGLDFSKRTLFQAKKRVHDKNLDNVHLVQADADNMPFASSIFDKVFAMTVLQNTPNPCETLAEIKRVSMNDALIAVTGLKKIFARQVFGQLLRNAGLKVLTLEDGDLKCYVAVCVNTTFSSSSVH